MDYYEQYEVNYKNKIFQKIALKVKGQHVGVEQHEFKGLYLSLEICGAYKNNGQYPVDGRTKGILHSQHFSSFPVEIATAVLTFC